MNDKRDNLRLIGNRPPSCGPVPVQRTDVYMLADEIQQLRQAVERLAAIVASLQVGIHPSTRKTQ